MRKLASLLIMGLTCSVLVGGPLIAQSASERSKADTDAVRSPVTDDVVVTGRKSIEADEAKQFARQASSPVNGQLAKFNIDACPMAIGFPPALAAQIVTRLQDVALAAGARIAKPGCKGNMLVIAADDGAAMVREMRRRNVHLLAGLKWREIDALIESSEPVRSWTLTELQNEDGDPVIQTMSSGWPILYVTTASRANPPTQQAIEIAVVVIDWPAMIGKSSTQIADYVAMRTLARTKPVRSGGAIDTILSLFDGTSTIPELSAADLAYLQSLYAMPGTRSAVFQVGQISNGIKKASAVAP